MVKYTSHGSHLVGDFPEGCQLCIKGGKLVLFVTGLCDRHCFYCPLSPERMGKDVVFANERPVKGHRDILEEASLMDALGTGMTGGDPLMVPDRTLRLLSLIKKEFGSEHHVHLYTSRTDVPSGLLSSLKKRGLDELRFHATLAHRDVILRSTKVGLNVGVEIPAMPGEVVEMQRIALLADDCGCSFLNLNELEMSETTAESFRSRGLRLVNDEGQAVMGSLEAALKVARFCEDNTGLDVHVCPSRLKDSVQLRNRLGRMARRVRKPYESIDEDNLLVKTTITPRRGLTPSEMQQLALHLRKEMSIGPDLLVFDETMARIETSPELAEEVARLVDNRDVEVALTEEYPSWDRLETERRPIN